MTTKPKRTLSGLLHPAHHSPFNGLSRQERGEGFAPLETTAEEAAINDAERYIKSGMSRKEAYRKAGVVFPDAEMETDDEDNALDLPEANPTANDEDAGCLPPESPRR